VSTVDHIVLVGLTGSIGAGKSFVAEVFREAGIPVLSSDDIARELMASDPDLRSEIIALCGSEAYTGNELNRAFLASKIFTDPDLREQVNRAVHPRTIAEQLKRAADLGREGHRVVACEAALIFESGGEDRFDYVVVVDADRTTRLARAAARSGLTMEQVEERERAQMPAAVKVRGADFVINNDGTLDKLRANAQFIAALLLTLPLRRSIESDTDDVDQAT